MDDVVMLVNELKKEIEKYNRDGLTKIIVELYKNIPKYKKEENDIDKFIKNINSPVETKKKVVSYDELKKEIIYFLDCVDNDYYAEPNKIVSKKERSSWRFKVKRFYKELNNISYDNENYNEATELLIAIFKRLSIGSHRLLFCNWDTFKALGVCQSEYYDIIVKRILKNGYTEDNLIKCIKMLYFPKDFNELSSFMFGVFINNLEDNNVRSIALSLLEDGVKSLKIDLKKAKDYKSKYNIENDINSFTQCILEIYILQNEYEKGIKYFKDNYEEDDNEIKEYILFRILDAYNLKDEWIKEYEKNIDLVDYRDSIKERYKKLKN